MAVDLAAASPLAAARHGARDADRAVVLIGFLSQGNLGLGYLAATLSDAGYRVGVVNFEASPERVLDVVRGCDPVLVGFSLLFQFYVVSERHAFVLSHQDALLAALEPEPLVAAY